MKGMLALMRYKMFTFCLKKIFISHIYQYQSKIVIDMYYY